MYIYFVQVHIFPGEGGGGGGAHFARVPHLATSMIKGKIEMRS